MVKGLIPASAKQERSLLALDRMIRVRAQRLLSTNGDYLNRWFGKRTAYGKAMRDLYEMFRDGVIEDALLEIKEGDPSVKISPWKYIPDQNSQHVGRLQTLALVRRFMAQCEQEFPEGMVVKRDGFIVMSSFLAFIKTHQDMGSTIKEMREAWGAMRSILRDM